MAAVTKKYITKKIFFNAVFLGDSKKWPEVELVEIPVIDYRNQEEIPMKKKILHDDV